MPTPSNPPVKKEIVLAYYHQHPDRDFRAMEVAEALDMPTHFVAVASGRLARAGLIHRKHQSVEGWSRPLTLYGARP